MNRDSWHARGGILILLLWVLCGCGSTSGSSGGNTQSNTSRNSSVSISTNRTTYAPTDSIEVSVTNHRQTSIFAYDTRASCTILGLQVQANGAWRDTQVARCAVGRRAMLVEIPANNTNTVTIKADLQSIYQTAFPVGTYRLVLTYFTSATSVAQQSKQNTTTTCSPPFNVVSSS